MSQATPYNSPLRLKCRSQDGESLELAVHTSFLEVFLQFRSCVRPHATFPVHGAGQPCGHDASSFLPSVNQHFGPPPKMVRWSTMMDTTVRRSMSRVGFPSICSFSGRTTSRGRRFLSTSSPKCWSIEASVRISEHFSRPAANRRNNN